MTVTITTHSPAQTQALAERLAKLLRPGDVLCVPPSGDRGLCENGGPVYRLQEGDTLDEIAARNGTNVEQLLRLNPNLLPSDFVSGQVICLPTKRRVAEESEPEV